ncbi:MAG: hypothetical protein UY83_C0006G0067 [Candidatus Adlerbacteria bacterium GW2011_GWA1_54_10]|uniref:Uncharacterized protein n=1 Tax=Candidatus Adlerbacteria bacterium GW2011_GWA1_54_10 TaxID=1618605 RepID=A0A0G1XXF3_9BACT|nr:MAG: hypothetical protein UY83_C0006G0067 [Candidatus Adlerbacteria bacterium GW2011_GWA1_54_10]
MGRFLVAPARAEPSWLFTDRPRENSKISQGEKAQKSTARNIFPRQGAPHARVTARRAVVAHDEVFSFPEIYYGGSAVALVTHVSLVECNIRAVLSRYGHFRFVDVHRLVRETHDR